MELVNNERKEEGLFKGYHGQPFLKSKHGIFNILKSADWSLSRDWNKSYKFSGEEVLRYFI